MTVLFIDDDEEVSRLYRRALETRQCLVIFCSTVDDALKASENNEYYFQVIIIDMMMPWGPYSASATGGGLRTGLVLYQDLDKRHKDSTLIILTTLQENQIPPGFVGGRVKICNKNDYSPRRFADLVTRMAPRGRYD